MNYVPFKPNRPRIILLYSSYEVDYAYLISLECSSALSSLLAYIRNDLLLDKPSGFFLVYTCYLGIKIVDKA
jgi:hypothetical protein